MPEQTTDPRLACAACGAQLGYVISCPVAVTFTADATGGMVASVEVDTDELADVDDGWWSCPTATCHNPQPADEDYLLAALKWLAANVAPACDATVDVP